MQCRKSKGLRSDRCFQVSAQPCFLRPLDVHADRYTEVFGKNTVYRFLENSKTNWERFTLLLSAKITRLFGSLTSEDRADVFIIDDSLYSKTGYKKTELVSRVFDHVSMTMQKGFRMLVLGWSDGNSFVPILHRLLASSDDKNILGVEKDFDKRSVAYKRRKQSRTKATEVVMDMLPVIKLNMCCLTAGFLPQQL